MLRYKPRRPKPVAKPVDWGLAAAVVGAAMALRMAGLAWGSTGLVAQPGDRVIFRGAQALVVVPARPAASLWAPAGPVCAFNVAQLQGALTVLAVRADAVLADWRGTTNAAGAGACASSGEILIAPSDYVQLLAVTRPKPVAFR
jgi:hypothetical protein